MFVLCKRNIILPSKDGSKKYQVKKDYIGEIPDWATQTDYFLDLVAAGKITVPASKKDKDTQSAAEKPVKQRKKVEE